MLKQCSGGRTCSAFNFSSEKLVLQEILLLASAICHSDHRISSNSASRSYSQLNHRNQKCFRDVSMHWIVMSTVFRGYMNAFYAVGDVFIVTMHRFVGRREIRSMLFLLCSENTAENIFCHQWTKKKHTLKINLAEVWSHHARDLEVISRVALLDKVIWCNLM